VIEQVRRSRAWAHGPELGLVVVAAIAFVFLLSVGRDMTFHSDEWSIIAVPRQPTLESWFTPHNEHWSTLLFLVYETIRGIVGLRSYIPYLATLLGLHVVASVGLYRLLALVTGRWLALGGATILLFLGSAYQDLLWAFQIGFVGSTAAGVWAITALTGERSRRAAVAAASLLTVAVATSGIGLSFLLAAIVLVLVRGPTRRDLVGIGVPSMAYTAWFMLVGRSAVAVNADVFSIEAISRLPATVSAGVVNAVSSTLGIDARIAAAAAVIIAAGVTIRLVLAIRNRVGDPVGHRAAAATPVLAVLMCALAGLLSLYVLIGLTRGQLGLATVTQSRYLYPAAVFIVVCLGAMIGAGSFRLKGSRLVAATGLGLTVVGLSLTSNLRALSDGHVVFREYADEVRSLTALVVTYQGAPAIDPDRSLFPMPPAPELLSLLRREGWPIHSASDDLARIRPEIVDRTLFRLVGEGTIVPVADPPPLQSVRDPPALATSFGGTVSVTGACLAVAGDAGGRLGLSMPDGGSVDVYGPSEGSLTASLGRFAEPQESSSNRAAIPSSGGLRVTAPDLGDGTAWRLNLGVEGMRTWHACSAP
jgi:hypothetical protein